MRTRVQRYILAVEAFLAIFLAKIIFMFFSPRLRARTFGHPFVDSPREIPPQHQTQARQIRNILQSIKRRFPWFLQNCVVEAIAGKTMLDRRAIPYTLYIGFRPSTKKPERRLDGHAWVRSGEVIVTGAPIHQGFEVVSYYGAKRK